MRLFRSKTRRNQWQKLWDYRSSIGSASVPVALLLWTLIIGALSLGYQSVKSEMSDDSTSISLGSGNSSATQRHLLAVVYYDMYCQVKANYVPGAHGLVWEQCDIEKDMGASGAFIFLYIIITLIIFIALAVVCDDFFVPSLETISEKLHLSEDVAGATFMAAGSSAPELFSSIAAVTFESDVGVGTIMGSAVFNLLVIISLTAAFAGKVLHLDWRPLVRDSVFYAVSVAVFIIFVWDTRFEWWEALLMLLLYVLYIITMVFNKKLLNGLTQLEAKCCCSRQVEPLPQDGVKLENGLMQFQHDRRNSMLHGISASNASLKKVDDNPNPRDTLVHMRIDSTTEKQLMVTMNYLNSKPGAEFSKAADPKPAADGGDDEPMMKCCCACASVRGSFPSKPVIKENATSCKRFNKKAVYVLKWVIFVVAFPFLVLFSWTIPDCSKEHNRKWYLVSFITSVLWIAALSFAMVTVVARMGCLIGIDSYVMSLVVLAAGTSIPDLLSSIIVARDGYGDMAVSNAIGSNVFDIDLGLGLPFLIRMAVDAGKPFDIFSQSERNVYCVGDMLFMPHAKFGFILLAILALAMLVFILSRFKLGKGLGITFFLTYLIFLAYAFIQEFVCNKSGAYNC